MPFPVCAVEPAALSAARVPAGLQDPLECVTNSSLAQAIRQLASVLRVAETMFEVTGCCLLYNSVSLVTCCASLCLVLQPLCQDLGNQCVDIHQRTARVNSRLGKLREAADNYDPKQQKIRELHNMKGCTKL